LLCCSVSFTFPLIFHPSFFSFSYHLSMQRSEFLGLLGQYKLRDGRKHHYMIMYLVTQYIFLFALIWSFQGNSISPTHELARKKVIIPLTGQLGQWFGLLIVEERVFRSRRSQLWSIKTALVGPWPLLIAQGSLFCSSKTVSYYYVSLSCYFPPDLKSRLVCTFSHSLLVHWSGKWRILKGIPLRSFCSYLFW
jgi:hypothetical protein